MLTGKYMASMYESHVNYNKEMITTTDYYFHYFWTVESIQRQGVDFGIKDLELSDDHNYSLLLPLLLDCGVHPASRPRLRHTLR